MVSLQLAKRKSLVSFNLCTAATIARPNSQLNINIDPILLNFEGREIFLEFLMEHEENLIMYLDCNLSPRHSVIVEFIQCDVPRTRAMSI